MHPTLLKLLQFMVGISIWPESMAGKQCAVLLCKPMESSTQSWAHNGCLILKIQLSFWGKKNDPLFLIIFIISSNASVGAPGVWSQCLDSLKSVFTKEFIYNQSSNNESTWETWWFLLRVKLFQIISQNYIYTNDNLKNVTQHPIFA